MAAKSISTLLSESYDAAEGGEGGEQEDLSQPEPGADETHQEEAPAEETAAPTEEPKPTPAAQEPAGKAPPKPSKPGAAANQPAASATGAEAPKAPQSWKPAVREHWGKLPKAVQEEVSRLDREVRKTLETTAQYRRVAESFERTLSPYRAFIQGDPVQAVDGLLRTAVQLQTAPPAHKAEIVAKIITGYGVDVEQLATLLEGKQPAQPQGSPQQFRDPRFDAFLGKLQETKQQRASSERQQAAKELGDFSAKAEFFEDVREDMADLIETAAKRGKPLTLEQAYERACLLHPEVRPLYEQRKAAQTAANARKGASTPRARAASSSVRHEPTAPSTGAKSKSLRAMLEENYDAAVK
jgi:hypothetical protein